MQTDTTQTDKAAADLADAFGATIPDGDATQATSAAPAPMSMPAAPRTARRAPRTAPVPVMPIAEAQTPATPSPSLRSFGAQLAGVLPGAERVEVFKLGIDGDEAGHELGIGVWQARDLNREVSAMSFLLKYCVPTYGAGAYHFFAVNARGQRVDAGWERVAAPTVSAPAAQQAIHAQQGSEATKILSDQVAEQRQEIKEMRRLAQQPATPVNILDQVKQFTEAAKLLGLEGGAANQYVAAMVQQQRPASDPAYDMKLERMQMKLDAMAEKLLASVNAAPPPPPPPPPPAPDPLAAITPLIVAMQTSADNNMKMIMTLITQQPKETFGVKEALLMMQEMRPPREEGFTAEKALGFMKETMGFMKPEPKETSDFKGRIQELLMVVKLGRLMGGGGEGGSSFNDVLMQLVNATPGSLGHGVMKRIAGEKEAAAKRLPATTAPKQPAPRQPAAAQTTPPRAPAPQPTPAAASAPTQPAANDQVPPPPAAETKPAEPQAPRPLPEGTREAAAKLEKAQGDERVGALMDFMQFLGTTDWLPLVQAILRHVVADERLTALKILGKLLNKLTEEKMLSAEAAKETYSSVERNFGHIAEAVRSNMEQRAQANEDGEGDGDGDGDGPEEEEESGDDGEESPGPAPDAIVELPPELEGGDEPDIIAT